MGIRELDWLYNNADNLLQKDFELLNEYEFFNQYKQGQLHHKFGKMLELFKIAIEMYKRYNKESHD